MGDIFRHSICYEDGGATRIYCTILTKSPKQMSRADFVEYLQKNHNSLLTGLECSGLASSQFPWCVLSNTANTISIYRGTGFLTNSTSGTVTDVVTRIY